MCSEIARIGFARRKNLSMGYSSVASGESKQNRFRFADAIHDRMAAGVERYSQAVRAAWWRWWRLVTMFQPPS